MVVGDWKKLAGVELSGEGIAGVRKRVPVGPADGWDGWVMRVFEIAPGGHTPRHRHPWPHINLGLEGRGAVWVDGEDSPMGAGGYAFVPAGAEHQFRNDGAEPFAFMCIVPEEGDK
jgi:quercetin dioxygenase-like cupin family protein